MIESQIGCRNGTNPLPTQSK